MLVAELMLTDEWSSQARQVSLSPDWSMGRGCRPEGSTRRHPASDIVYLQSTWCLTTGV